MKWLRFLDRLNETHPYVVAFAISMFFWGGITAYRPAPPDFREHDSVNPLEILDIDSYTPPRRKAKKNISEEGELSDEPLVDKAEGEVDDASILDSDMDPSIPVPVAISNIAQVLKKHYPPEALKLQITAKVYFEFVVTKQGQVVQVNPFKIKLSNEKQLPNDMRVKYRELFRKAVIAAFATVKYEPIVFKGKKRPVRVRDVISFTI